MAWSSGQALDVMVERIETGRGDDSRLAHGATEQVLEAPRLLHAATVAGNHGAERAAEALRQAERDRVELASVLGRGDAACDRGVHETRAVEMEAQVMAAGFRDDSLHLGERPHTSPAAVVRVLDADDPRPRSVQIAPRTDGVTYLVGREDAAVGGERLHREAGVDGRPAQLVAKDVRHRLGDDLVARLGQRSERDLISHRGRRDEDRLVLAEQLGGALLERDHGRVFALLLVADNRFGNGLAHARRGLRDGVRAKVDHDLTVAPRNAGTVLPPNGRYSRNRAAEILAIGPRRGRAARSSRGCGRRNRRRARVPGTPAG